MLNYFNLLSKCLLLSGHINSCSTSGDHLLIQDLKPNTVYTMIVEARRKQHYIALDGEYSHYVSYHVHYHILTSWCGYLENTIIHGKIYRVQQNMIININHGYMGYKH